MKISPYGVIAVRKFCSTEVSPTEYHAYRFIQKNFDIWNQSHCKSIYIYSTLNGVVRLRGSFTYFLNNPV